jgi:hypothetical protein
MQVPALSQQPLEQVDESHTQVPQPAKAKALTIRISRTLKTLLITKGTSEW